MRQVSVTRMLNFYVSVTKGPCKRTQHCWPTTRNIVGPNMLRPFAWNHNNVGTCWQLVACCLKPVKLLGPCKRTQHCLPKNPNNTQQCCDLLRPFAWAFIVRTIISHTKSQYGIWRYLGDI